MISSVVDTIHASYDRVMNKHEVLVTPLSHQLLLEAILLCSAFCDVPCVVIFCRRTEAVIICPLTDSWIFKVFDSFKLNSLRFYTSVVCILTEN